MAFDKNWEKSVYSKRIQLNQFPFDWVVSSTKRYVKKNFRNLSVVELGCGTGNNLTFFEKLKFKRIVGIEGSKTAVNIARKRFKKNKKIKFFLGDFVNAKFEKRSFDLCIDRGSITHNSKKDIFEIVENIHSFLKPGGFLFSSLFSSEHYANKKKNVSFKKEINSTEGLVTSFFNKNEIKKLFKKFKIISFLHEKKSENIGKRKNICWWYIVLKKK